MSEKLLVLVSGYNQSWFFANSVHDLQITFIYMIFKIILKLCLDLSIAPSQEV